MTPANVKSCVEQVLNHLLHMVPHVLKLHTMHNPKTNSGTSPKHELHCVILHLHQLLLHLYFLRYSYLLCRKDAKAPSFNFLYFFNFLDQIFFHHQILNNKILPLLSIFSHVITQHIYNGAIFSNNNRIFTDILSNKQFKFIR